MPQRERRIVGRGNIWGGWCVTWVEAVQGGNAYEHENLAEGDDLPFLAGVLVLGSTAGVRAEEVTKTFTVSGHASVKVGTDDGSVRVSTGDIKQVEVRVIYSGYKLDQDLRVSATQSGDTVEVVAKTSSKWGSIGEVCTPACGWKCTCRKTRI